MGLFVFLLLASTHFSGSNSVRSRLRGTHSPLNPILFMARDDERHPKRRTQSSTRAEMKSHFVDDCSSFLLSPDSIEDGIVSQNEYASFLLSLCRSEDLCDDETNLEFEQLDLGLQLEFVRGACPYVGLEERISCIDDLESMWLEGGEFGFRVSEDGIDAVSRHVKDMCMDTYADVVKMRLTGALEPALNPINESSVGPSNQPSNAQPTSSSLLPSTEDHSISSSTSPTPIPATDDSKATQIPAATAGLSESPSPQKILPTPVPSLVKETRSTDSPVSFTTGSPSLSFVRDCTHFLLSPHSVRDGIVSQIEFAEFLTHRCVAGGLCDDESYVTFQELDVGLQLEFILVACQDYSPSEKTDCIDELKADWRNGIHFGFDANDANIEVLVGKLCSSAFNYAVSMELTATSEPTSAKPTNLPTIVFQVMPPSPQVYERSRSPSFGPVLSDIDDNSSQLHDKKSLRPKRALACLSAACAVFLLAAGGLLAYRRSHLNRNERIPDDYYSKDANHYGISTHDQWARSPSFPFPYSSSSCSSSSSSFRDYRFVPVFGPDGQSIVQFDPNTAGAVVIGSVTIGGSSSISTGLFINDERSPSKISIGEISQLKQQTKSETNSGSELSSLSSGRSALMRTEHRRKKLFGSSQPPKPAASIDLRSESSDKSAVSRRTVPWTQSKSTRFERRLVRFDNQVSFADWKAASFLISEYRKPDNVTDSAAAKKQKQFFFDLFTTPFSEDSDLSTDHASFHSLSTLARHRKRDFSQLLIPSEKCDISVERNLMSAMSSNLVSMGKEGDEKHVTPTGEVLIPWRKGGFSSTYQPSDGKQSGESACSSQSTCMEQWDSCRLTGSKQSSVALFVRPVRFLLLRVTSNVKGWFKRQQYHNLNGRLHEDPSVISMQSYSSKMQLLPSPYTPLFGLPNLILGTWAAATIPVEPKQSVDAGAKFGNDRIKHVKLPVAATDLQVEKEENSPKSTILGIEKRDIASCLSVFESSTGWSPSSNKHISSFSSSSSITQHRDKDVSLIASSTQTEKFASAQDGLSNHDVDHMNVGEISSENAFTEDSSDPLKTKELNLGNKAENNIIVNIVSDSSASGSCHTDDIFTIVNKAGSHRDVSNTNTVYHGTINLNGINSTHNTPKVPNQKFFMKLASDIQADSSSGDDISSTDNEDWSHNISESSSSSDSDDTDDNAFHSQSLSLSLGSETNSASQAIDWAINREVSKQTSSLFNDSMISVVIEE